MSDNDFSVEGLAVLLKDISAQLGRQARMLERIGKMIVELQKDVDAKNRKLPFVRPIERWANFDWNSIGAAVVESDYEGPSMVEWNKNYYARRNGTGKMGNAIWYSRSTGMGEGGAEYEVLVRFKEITIESLSPALKPKQSR